MSEGTGSAKARNHRGKLGGEMANQEVIAVPFLNEVADSSIAPAGHSGIGSFRRTV